MHAADLFKDYLTQYRKSIKPPYKSSKDYLTFAATLFILISIPLTVVLVQHAREIRSRAAAGDSVGYWKFDEGTGNSVADSSGNGNNGSWLGTLGNQWTGGKIGGAGKFNGVDNYIALGSPSNLNLTRYTVSAWVNVLTFPDTSPDHNGLVLYRRDPNTWWEANLGMLVLDTNGHARIVHVRNDDTTIDKVDSNTDLRQAGWKFVVGTYDGTNLRIYIDGKLENTAAAGDPETGGGQTLRFGHSQFQNESLYFPGSIDEIRIYNRPLSATEITDLYNATTPDCPSTNDEFSSTTLDPKWSWVRENPSLWSLTSNPGNLRITTQNNDIWQYNNDAPVLLQIAPSGDFQVVTKLTLAPTDAFQQGGPVIYQDDDNYVRFTYGYFPGVGGAGFEFGNEIGAVFTSTQVAAPAGNTFYLKITKSGQNYNAFYSSDNNVWIPINAEKTNALTVSKIGLAAFSAENSGAPEIPADFDFFHLICGSTTPPTNSAPNAPTNLGPDNLVDGSSSTANAPSFTFTLSDPDAADQVKYQIQLDDSADFSSPVVDYTSAYGSQGPTSFTLGQDPGSGSYAVGAVGQTLAPASYYWRVKAIDNSSNTLGAKTSNWSTSCSKLDKEGKCP